MNKFFISGLSLMAMVLYSCSDDEIANKNNGGVQLEPGTEAVFSVQMIPSPEQSRTVYGEETDNAFPIYWKWSENDVDSELDHIYIHSPQAAEGKRKAEYIVKPESKEFKGSAPVVKAGGDGVELSEAASHSFYGFYPAKYVIQEKFDGSQASISARMPSVQTVTCGPDPDPDGVYVAAHDMDYCFMTAKAPDTRRQPVELKFKALVSVLDITLAGPADGDTEESYTVSSVLIRSKAQSTFHDADMPKEFVGDFTYDYTSGHLELLPGSGATASSNILTVNICGKDGTKGVVLRKGEKLNLKAFLLPVDNLNALSVEVVSDKNDTWSVSLQTPDGRQNLLTAGSVHKVVLPGLEASKAGINMSAWMSELSDDKRITDLSIPGTYDSFSYLKPGYEGIQTIGIMDQFRAGIRAFQARVIVADGDDTFIGKGWKKHLGVTIDGTNELIGLGEAMKLIYDAIYANEAQEFCVLQLIHEKGLSTNRDYYSALKNYADYAADAGISPSGMSGYESSDLSIRSLRGHVLMQALVNSSPSTDLAALFKNPNNSALCPYSNIEQWIGPTGAQIYNSKGEVVTRDDYEDIGPKSWSELEGASLLLSWSYRYQSAAIAMTPMTFGNIGSYEYSVISDPAATYGSQSSINDKNLRNNQPGRPTNDEAEATGKYGLAYMNARAVYDNNDYHDGNDVTVVSGGMLCKSNATIDHNKTYTWIGNYNNTNFLWLANDNTSWTETNVGNTYARNRLMWDRSYTSGGSAITMYTNTGGRVLASTCLGTYASTGTCLRATGSVEDSNHLLLLAFLRLVHGNNGTEYAKPHSLNIMYNFDESSVAANFVNQPLGMVFMSTVPGVDVIVSKIDSYKNTAKYHNRQLIRFLVRHSME